MEQKGLDSFKRLIRKWEALSVNIQDRPVGVPIILPDIFMISKSGTGRTHVLHLLGEYLACKANLMDFYGDVKFFEFMLNYCPPREPFTEIQRLMSEISDAAGFRSEYRGIVYIDVDEWRDHFEEKHFVSFLEYIADNSDDWLVVFSVTDDDAEKNARIEAFLSAYLRLEHITIEPPTVDELMRYLEELLLAYGISIDGSAQKLLSESVECLCHNKYFDGYKTIKMLGKDIAYSIYAEGSNPGTPLSAAEVSLFSKDSDYLKRTVMKIEKIRKIGF